MSSTKTFTVTAPNAAFSGRRCGVEFTNGKAQKVPYRAALQLVALGYQCPEAEAEAEKVRAKAAAKADAAGDGK